MKSRFKFTAGPWNVNEGVEAFGPGVRETIDLAVSYTHLDVYKRQLYRIV